MIICLCVRNKKTGEYHKIGTDKNDCLFLMDGEVKYMNLKTDVMTPFECEFAKHPDDAEGIWMVSPEAVREEVARNVFYELEYTALQMADNGDRPDAACYLKAFEQARKKYIGGEI